MHLIALRPLCLTVMLYKVLESWVLSANYSCTYEKSLDILFKNMTYDMFMKIISYTSSKYFDKLHY